MKKIIKSSKGAALATVIIVFAVVAIVGTTVLSISLSQTTLSEASEDTTAAYYYARSAVEVVSSNIEEKFDELDDLYGIVEGLDETATEEARNAAIGNYNQALSAFNALELIPASPAETFKVDVGGILPNPLTVLINLVNSGGSEVIELSCTAIYDGHTSSARAQIGTFTEDSIDIPIQSEVDFDIGDLGDDTVFSWGSITIQGANITMNDYDAAHTAMMSAQGVIRDKHNNPITEDYVNSTPAIRDMPVLVPPTALYPNHSGTSLAGVQHLDHNSSGYYGPLFATDKHGNPDPVPVDWNVNTSGGDVVLIFDGIHLDNPTKINVTGPGNLYIYIKEPYNGTSTTPRTLLDLSNKTEITTNGTNGDPRTYFIVYNDVLQKKQAELDTTLLPADTAKTLSNDTGNLDIVNIINNDKAVSAYFYAPGCQINCNNLSAIDGAVYGSKIDIQGNKTFNYVPFDFEGMIDSAGEDIDGTIVHGYIPFPYFESVYKRVWVR